MASKTKSKLVRIGEIFIAEIEDIKRIRLEKGIDKKKKSTRRLTNLIIKHQGWKKIKEDTINYKQGSMKNE